MHSPKAFGRIGNFKIFHFQLIHEETNLTLPKLKFELKVARIRGLTSLPLWIAKVSVILLRLLELLLKPHELKVAISFEVEVKDGFSIKNKNGGTLESSTLYRSKQKFLVPVLALF